MPRRLVAGIARQIFTHLRISADVILLGMKIIVGSHNPVKAAAAKEAFTLMFPSEDITIESRNAPSGVREQPFGSLETKTGARNRALACKREHPDADYFVGMEGGVEFEENEMWAFAWMCVVAKEGKIGFGRTGSFLLPPALTNLVQQGKEMGHATDEVFSGSNIKQKGGTVGRLTDGNCTRTDFYREAMFFALIPFINSDLYPVDEHDN